MRLWSVHPMYLDTKGLLAVWREGLLAQRVLLGKTKGYKNHPQLERFKNVYNPKPFLNPLFYLGSYLYNIWEEADKRKFKFDKTKIKYCADKSFKMQVTQGQVKYEFQHLQNKLQYRCINKYWNNITTIYVIEDKINTYREPLSNPLFEVVEGDIEKWEKVK